MKKKNLTPQMLSKFCNHSITLLMLLLLAPQLGAQTNTTIYGESLFRSNGYGVTNHNFRLRNFVPSTGFNFITNATTGPCGSEIYTAVTRPSTVALNTIMVLPTSINNNADYLNGVSTFDLVHISRHIAGIASLNTLIPTADGPYRRISADATNDRLITQADIDMIRGLILGTRTNLTRNSWEWVRDNEVRITNPTGFNTNPYNFVISYNWPGPDGIIMSGVTYADLNANNWKYYSYRTTKIGDIAASASSSANTWVCGTGTYRADIATVNKGELSTTKINANTSIKIGVEISATEKLTALELPIDINPSDFEVVHVEFAKGFDAKWHFAKETGRLTFVALEENGSPFAKSNGDLITIELKAKQDISDISKSVKWSADRNIELINPNAELVKGSAKLTSKEIVGADLYATLQSGTTKTLSIVSNTNESATIQVVNVNGQNIWKSAVQLKAGINNVILPNNNEKGILVVSIKTNKKNISLKYTN